MCGSLSSRCMLPEREQVLNALYKLICAAVVG
jgi:hypothetical protein